MDGLDGLNAIQYVEKGSCPGAGSLSGRHKIMENDVKYATELIIEVVQSHCVHLQHIHTAVYFGQSVAKKA